MATHKLLKKIIVKGRIEAMTGIAIGGTNSAMAIGGVDKGVIRNPVSGEPYIPGSTLKGKMRSLLEMNYGTVGETEMGIVKNGPSEDYAHRSTKLFGNAVRSTEQKQRPSRIIVRDARLTDEQSDGKSKADFFKNTDLLYTEVKTEVVIDRITSRAMPRQLERVPAGSLFTFELVLNIFEEDTEKNLVDDLFSALRLVQNDYIGGAGSRGSGQIRFDIQSVKAYDAAYYRHEKTSADDLTETYRPQFPN